MTDELKEKAEKFGRALLDEMGKRLKEVTEADKEWAKDMAKKFVSAEGRILKLKAQLLIAEKAGKPQEDLVLIRNDIKAAEGTFDMLADAAKNHTAGRYIETVDAAGDVFGRLIGFAGDAIKGLNLGGIRDLLGI